jgi:AP-1 complex subunit beta-1
VLLDQLIGQIATLASVYHKPPEAFVTKTAPSREARTEEEEDFDAEYDENEASFQRY